METMRFSQKTFPIALMAACVAAFGLLIPWLGFYQDDWYQIWFGRAYGTQVFVDYYAGERPFMAFLYMLTTPLIGNTPLAWQIFGLLTRWLAALAVWWFLRLVWPRHPQQTAWAALLFALYPGFRIQYASVIYSHYFLQLAIQILSLGAMLAALQRPGRSRVLMTLSWAGAVVGLFSSEYFFGLELIRPIFLWWALRNQEPDWRDRMRRTVLYWTPYLAFLSGFVVWRIFIFQFPTYQPFYLQNPGAGPLKHAFDLMKTIGQDMIEMGLLAWGLPAQALFKGSSLRPAVLASAGLALICGLGLFVYLMRLNGRHGDGEGQGKAMRSFAIPAILMGALLLLASGWPFWFVDLKVDTDLNGGSRFGISFMLGSALFLVGLIDLTGWRKTIKIGVVSILAGFSVGFHFLDADFYREVNRTQASFFQQLAWRAPGLKPGTLILINSFEEHVLSGDNSLTAALNWIYQPEPPFSLEYMLFYIPTRMQTGSLSALEPGIDVEKVFRTAVFHGSTDQALVIYYPHPHCLVVLDPKVHQELPRPGDMPREIKAGISISNLDQILPAADPAAELPKALFKYRLDEKSWCCYYQKAELARQQGDWEWIMALADEAINEDTKFQTTWELLPFIEGYARGGRFEQARQLTLEVNRAQPEGRATTAQVLCTLWKRLQDESDKEQESGLFAGEMRAELECR